MAEEEWQMKWYAVRYAYGSDTLNNGQRGDRVVTFASRAERDHWVDDGPAYVGPGERQSIRASSALVRRHRWDQDHGII
jgi:hypothetical protein